MEKELLEIFESGTKYAQRKRNMLETHQEPEDFGSYCVERKLKKQYSRLGWMFTDYLRAGSGRKGSNGYTEKSSLKRAASLNAKFGDADIEQIERLYVDSGESNYEAREQLEHIKSKLRITNEKHRKIIYMFIDGFKNVEIANKFNVSESLISLLIKKYLAPVRTKQKFSKLSTLNPEVKKWLSTN